MIESTFIKSQKKLVITAEPIRLSCKVDSMGRLLLTKPVRESMGFENGMRLDVYLTDQGLLIRKTDAESAREEN